MSHPYDVLVIGGGVSGMMAAITAAENGAEVVILEGNDRVGKKILSTGNGRCNFTNEQIGVENYYDADPAFVKPVLDQFSNRDLINWLQSIGVDSKVQSGRVYPANEQATAILDILRLQMNRRFVRAETFKKVRSIRKNDGLFEVSSVNGEFAAKKVVLACGSKAAPHTGSDGSGYLLAEKLGMKVKKPLPALTNLRLNAPYSQEWDGVRVDGTITILVDGREVASDTGQLQLTDYGVSGIPTFQVSRYAIRALDEGKEVQAILSFLPGMDEEQAFDCLMARYERVKEYLARDFFIGLLPKKLAAVLIKQAGFRHSKPIRYIGEDGVRKLAKLMSGMKTDVRGHGNFKQAQVCSGGVLTSELVPGTLESRKNPGLYLAGELIDVDGMCGGYNLQWAFSSGAAAGKAAAGR